MRAYAVLGVAELALAMVDGDFVDLETRVPAASHRDEAMQFAIEADLAEDLGAGSTSCRSLWSCSLTPVSQLTIAVEQPGSGRPCARDRGGFSFQPLMTS